MEIMGGGVFRQIHGYLIVHKQGIALGVFLSLSQVNRFAIKTANGYDVRASDDTLSWWSSVPAVFDVRAGTRTVVAFGLIRLEEDISSGHRLTVIGDGTGKLVSLGPGIALAAVLR